MVFLDHIDRRDLIATSGLEGQAVVFLKPVDRGPVMVAVLGIGTVAGLMATGFAPTWLYGLLAILGLVMIPSINRIFR